MTVQATPVSEHVTLVTGGARGIGAAIVRRMHASGHRTVVWDLAGSSSPLPETDLVEVDVTELAAVEQAWAQTLARHGRVDHVINSAGWAGPTGPLETIDPQVWERIVRINLFGVYHVCRVAAPYLRRRGAGRIVIIASLAGKEGTPNASAYSAAKAAVIALTKSLGKELATSGVLVNAIAPAAIDTAMLAQMSPDHVRIMIEKSPMKRLGTADEVAEMVAWLCSDACSFNTGAVFDLSGGRATY
jgi:3-oxoacyl-[acyl-carrier protein] reductase